MNTLAIEAENLSFSYRKQPVIKNIQLKVTQGEFLALIGPNGGGKTTLLKILLGLLRPTTGKVRIFGKDPFRSSCAIGYVPQEINANKDFPISVLDVTLMGRLKNARWGRRYSTEDFKIVQNALELTHMWDLRHERIGNLSGGQRQRVFIARALSICPEILFLDEPIANVDTHGQKKIYEILKDLSKTVTILMATHDTSVVLSIVTSVACINQHLHHHHAPEITSEMIDMGYHFPWKLVTHEGKVLRVLGEHEKRIQP